MRPEETAGAQMDCDRKNAKGVDGSFEKIRTRKRIRHYDVFNAEGARVADRSVEGPIECRSVMGDVRKLDACHDAKSSGAFDFSLHFRDIEVGRDDHQLPPAHPTACNQPAHAAIELKLPAFAPGMHIPGLH